MKKFIIGLVALLVIGGIASFFWPSVNSSSDLPFINYQDAFSQEEAEYFVYFYQENCSFCQQLEPSVMEAHRAGVPIYVVDMGADENQNAWYDWDAHHAEHTTVVGEVINGEEVFFDDYNEADYSPEDGWVVSVQGDDIVAVLNRADFNRDPQTPEAIEVAGTPTMMHVVNGRSVGFDMGVEENRQLMAGYSGLEAPLFE